jgi:hypothetical protein
MSGDFAPPASPALRLMAMLKAARDLGLEQGAIDEVALGYDPRRPDLAGIAGALAAALLRQRPLALPDAV